MPRVNVIEKSRKPKRCDRCRETIPVGSSYRWMKPRYGSKRIRCMKHKCRFRPTDLSSAKTALVEEAIEDAREEIACADSYEAISDILSSVADTAREVGEEYRDASSNWAGGQNDEFEEKADACESFADDLEGWEFSDEHDEEAVRAQATEGEEEQDPDELWEEVLQEMRSEAESALDDFSV